MEVAVWAPAREEALNILWIWVVRKEGANWGTEQEEEEKYLKNTWFNQHQPHKNNKAHSQIGNNRDLSGNAGHSCFYDVVCLFPSFLVGLKEKKKRPSMVEQWNPQTLNLLECETVWRRRDRGGRLTYWASALAFPFFREMTWGIVFQERPPVIPHRSFVPSSFFPFSFFFPEFDQSCQARLA